MKENILKITVCFILIALLTYLSLSFIEGTFSVTEMRETAKLFAVLLWLLFSTIAIGAVLDT